MVEVYIAIAGVAVLTATVLGRQTAPTKVEYVVVEKPVAEGHVHSATRQDSGGWWCLCGRHQHVYLFAIEDSEEKRCQCGKSGIDKEWS